MIRQAAVQQRVSTESSIGSAKTHGHLHQRDHPPMTNDTKVQGAPPAGAAQAVVVIGASVGGVEAIRTVVHGLPASFPAAVVIVLHRSAVRPWLLDAVLQRWTDLSVQWIENETPLLPGVIYLAPPDRHVHITGERTVVPADGRRIRFVLSSANPLFESAAEVYGPRAIGVVLSGGGFNATDGVQAIASRGGFVIAQDQASAKHFSMPASAIGTGAVHAVLPLGRIAPELIRRVIPPPAGRPDSPTAANPQPPAAATRLVG